MAIVSAGFVVAPIATAQTYCVQAPAGCVGVAQPTVAAAMIAATLTPERDLVRIGPGDFLEPAWPGNGQQIDIVGSGAAQTIIRPQTNATLFQVPAGGTLSDVGFVGAAGAGGTLLQSSGAVTRIRVTSAPTFNGSAVSLSGSGTISSSTIVLPTDGGASAISGLGGSGTHRITDVDVQAAVGIDTQAPAVIQRARVTAGRFGITTRGSVRVDNALIRLLNVPSFTDAAGLVAESNSGNGNLAEIIGSHVTVIGSGRAGEAGATALGFATGFSATVVLRDSVIRGTPISVMRNAASSAAAIIATHSAFDPTTALALNASGGSLDIFSPTNTNADPGFVNAASGDFRLSAASSLRDAGSFSAIGADESATDLDGNPRILDAAGVCGATGRRDMGAFEFAPGVRVGVAVTPGEVAVGVPATFTAPGSCDPGSAQAPIVEWTFDDGATATGDPVTHAFATPGTHQATVTVRRANGASSVSATVSLVVKDVTAPRMVIATTGLRLNATGAARISLRCPRVELSGPCTGILTLKTATRVPVRVGGRIVRRVITVGSVRFRIAAGRLVAVNVRLTAAGRALVTNRGALNVRAFAAARDQVGNRRTVSRIIVIRPSLVR